MTTPLPPILFEDDHLLAFDKPSGLLVAPDRWDKSIENLMKMVHAKLSPDYFNAHRLDKDTSGIVLLAKTKPALDDICRQFEQQRVRKEYVALVKGGPPHDDGLIDKPIMPDLETPGKMRPVKRGKKAETEYMALKRWRGYSMVLAKPRTGRQHQIRVHLALVHCPILADELYGNGEGLLLSRIKKNYKESKRGERPLIGRLALHAAKLTVKHPATGETLTIESPLPKDFQIAIKYLDKFAG